MLLQPFPFDRHLVLRWYVVGSSVSVLLLNSKLSIERPICAYHGVSHQGPRG